MNWIIYSMLMYISSVYFYVGLRYFQKKNIDNLILNIASFGIYGISFLILGYVGGYDMGFPINLFLLTIVVFFFTSYFGNTFSLMGTKSAPNPGYSLIIQKSYAIYTSIVSVWLFSSEFTWKTLLSIIVVLFFMFVMVYDPTRKERVGSSHDNKWILYSFLAFFLFGALSLYTKWLIDVSHVSVMSRTAFGALIVVGFFLVELTYKVKRKGLQLNIKIRFSELVFLITLGLGLGAFNYFMNAAITSAPNLGYVNIINGASISAITLVSALVYKENLSLQKFVGIVGVTVGLGVLFI